ncbi:hypothetical protein GCM10009655_16460 [Rhodoglobus aureus]|uniref:Uncharacterized protein n=1 Tax=Rhodoglobus aureus TaxID=191497 RepID=A0ABN1VN37_9MICO
MKFFLRILGGVFILIGLGTLSNNIWGDGPGGALSVAEDIASVLDSLLAFGASYAFFALASKREAREQADAAREAAYKVIEPYTQHSLYSTPRAVHPASPPPPPQAGWPAKPTEEHRNSASAIDREPDVDSPAKSRVEVHGYMEEFAVNPTVKVLWNGVEVGSVSRFETFIFGIDADGEISFRTPTRSTSRQIKAGSDTKIRIAWDSETGALSHYLLGPIWRG